MTTTETPFAADIICLSHLRWDFVFQRPNHIMSRFARKHRVFFVEEPIFGESEPRLYLQECESNIVRIVPHLLKGTREEDVPGALEKLIAALFPICGIEDYILWYYTPMALSFTRQLKPLMTVYDCMDELSAFSGAPALMRQREAELFAKADVVFTGGQSLYESKRRDHPNVHLFPSSVDIDHFSLARQALPDPADQAAIPHPRLGFFGVIDERMDLDLIAEVARARPAWQIVMVGPLAKISPDSLPKAPNIHYPGKKAYADLPNYLAGWDVAIMPFAQNDATRFISPTKTLEYLAAGKPVVSTPIRDVVWPYGERGLVRIAATAPEFIEAVEVALGETDRARWLEEVDAFVRETSWAKTFQGMSAAMHEALAAKARVAEAGLATSQVMRAPRSEQEVRFDRGA